MPLGSFRLNTLARVIGSIAPAAWSLANVTTKTKFFSVATQTINSTDIYIRPDGSKMYVTSSTAGSLRVFQYTLSTLWDTSTAVYDNVFFQVSFTPQAITFRPDGTRMYLLDDTNNQVNEYTLSTAWDMSTATLARQFSVAAQEADLRGITFRPDGLKMYIIGQASDQVRQYNLPTAWSLLSATLETSFNIATQDTQPTAVFFKDDGTVMYVGGSFNNAVYQYALSTAWNVSTASLTTTLKINELGSGIQGLFFRDNGTRFYILGTSSSNVSQFTLTTPWSLTDRSGLDWGYVAAQATNPTGLFFRTDGTKMYLTDSTADRIFQYSLSTAWNIGTITYDGVSLNVAGVEGNPSGLFFRDDGVKMYMIGSGSDTVRQYNLTTAWNVSTATQESTRLVNAQDTSPAGVFFRSDGVKMYVVGGANSRVFQYTLSTAWTVSTAVYDSVQSPVITNLTDVVFKDDGTAMFVTVSDVNDVVRQYSLSTPWTVSTATLVTSFPLANTETQPLGLAFKPDGTKFYVVGPAMDSVFEYDVN